MTDDQVAPRETPKSGGEEWTEDRVREISATLQEFVDAEILDYDGDAQVLAARAAFDSLLKQIARLVRERDEAREKAKPDGVIQFVAPAYLAELRADLATARDERDEYKECFALEVDAVARGIKMWQAAHPGNDLRWPDKGALVAWTLGHLSAARARLDSARALLEGARSFMQQFELRGASFKSMLDRIDAWLAGGEKTT